MYNFCFLGKFLVNFSFYFWYYIKPVDDDNGEAGQQERQVMSKLKVKLRKEKCAGTLYGKLLAAKLKKLPYHHLLRAKHDIDNIMFKYMYINCVPEKESQSFSPVINTIVQPLQRTLMPFRHNTPNNMTLLTNLPSPEIAADQNQLVKIWLADLFFKGKGTT